MGIGHVWLARSQRRNCPKASKVRGQHEARVHPRGSLWTNAHVGTDGGWQDLLLGVWHGGCPRYGRRVQQVKTW